MFQHFSTKISQNTLQKSSKSCLKYIAEMRQIWAKEGPIDNSKYKEATLLTINAKTVSKK